MSPESFFKDINNHYSNKFPFVVYKKGNQNQNGNETEGTNSEKMFHASIHNVSFRKILA